MSAMKEKTQVALLLEQWDFLEMAAQEFGAERVKLDTHVSDYPFMTVECRGIEVVLGCMTYTPHVASMLHVLNHAYRAKRTIRVGTAGSLSPLVSS